MPLIRYEQQPGIGLAIRKEILHRRNVLAASSRTARSASRCAPVTVQPDLPQVACFDTAFHRGHPELADWYALPRRFHDEGIRRYGFHGLSYEYVASVLPELAPAIAAGRVVVAHLGSGASMCAIP